LKYELASNALTGAAKVARAERAIKAEARILMIVSTESGHFFVLGRVL